MMNIKNTVTFNYHPKLLEMLIALTLPGVLSANIIAPLIAAYILYDIVPSVQIYSWLFLHLILFSGRLFMAKRLEYHLKIESDDVTRYLKMILLLTTLTALLYATAVWASVLYGASDLRTVIITVIVISLAAGAVSTLVSIYHVYLFYIVFSMIPLIGAIIYHGGELFNVYAFLLLIFTLTILAAGHRQYILLKNSISLKETFETIDQKSSDGIALIQNNRFKDCNESIVKMFQYGSKEELLRAHLSNFMPKFQADGALSVKKMLLMAKIALDNGRNDFEWLYKRTDGELFWTEVVLTKINLDGEELIHGTWRDISDRKKLEEEKEAAEEKQKNQQKVYELIFNNATDGVLILDEGVFTDCNNAIVKMLKYDNKEDLLNVHPSELSPERQPDGRLSFEKANEMIALAYQNRGYQFEWVHVKATGEEFWTEIMLTPVVVNNKEILHVVWRDISQRKELEQANASLKERMELAFDGSRDGLWDWDVKNDTLYLSPRWKEMLGYRDDELENNFSTWQERVHPDDLEEVFKEIELNLEGETESFESKYRLQHKDGHWVWIYARGKTQFDDNGKAVRMIGTHTDLSTEINLTTMLSQLNHSLETKIEEAVSGLNKAQQQAKLGSWQLDLTDNSLVWSDETYNLFELPINNEMATYENFLNAIHPDDREKVNAAYTESLETQEPYEIVHRLLMADGRIKHVKEHCETSFDTEGKPLVSVGTIQDITAEHMAVQELRHKDEVLFKQSRLAQMGEMISMIAHQWRQPLNAISLTSAALELKLKNDQYDKHFFESRLVRISEYVQHLSSTIDDFRNFFKSDKIKQEIIFSEVIESALNFVRIGLENRNITVQTECNCKGSVLSYPNELLQVVLNLIKNAEDALLENNIADPRISIRCYSDAGKAVLEIEDNAGGIDEPIMEKVFEPYFTTKDEHNGTGLGLYMSKVIIEEHCDGVLSVSNSRDGALFKIELTQD